AADGCPCTGGTRQPNATCPRRRRSSGAAPGGYSSVRWIRSRGRGRCPKAVACDADMKRRRRFTRRLRSPVAGGRAEARERLLAAEQLDALEQAGRDGGAGDGDADRLEALPRLQAEPLEHLSERRLDRLGRERLHAG